ncbi:hypothetical protein NDI56_13015 [Haloarcula sp. S1CR25-12]|uniref:DUF8108 domain-containing protein n=1 Tax=Haloarcula saliterrae TaxID=2950534 RepID=A0ABU2FDI5_9EURY|nr:hypothetical protein [Haloarcula sp. S1CR25-12]MDS0260318.1 hypothetical protein [Haloarcula sp. S1CR25-12]
MSPSDTVELADAVSDVLYALAGWLLVGLGGLGVVVPVLAFLRGAGSNPLVPAVIVLFSLCLVALGVFVNPRLRRRLDRRRSLGTFGRSRVVEHRVLRSEPHRTDRCVDCGTQVSEGELRRYREEFCLAGVPVYTHSEGRNAYCLDCATADVPSEETAADRRERTEPLTES